MATSLASMPPQTIPVGMANDSPAAAEDDPFVINHQHPAPSHRYSAFDSQLFNLNASSSPTQAKRALEAHLAETERRLQETSKLGTSLVNQRAQLAEKLKDVEKQQDEVEIGPELRQKLIELEKEYNEVGRDSARAFLGPKSRPVVSDDVGPTGTPGGGPATYSSQATASPTKLSVPPRKQRNQPSSRVDNIEFATEISTSLLAQVRQLQVLLAERDEALKNVTLERARLELEAEGFSQRLKALDESEQRYKDENWSLETQTHELISAAKESEEREKRLTAALNATTSVKQNAQRELDEIKQAHGKLLEEHTARQKAHDSELHSLRRNLTTGDTERITLQRKVEELTSQNQELARAVASRLRGEDADALRDLGSDDESGAIRASSPDGSPPPSPSKGTPRHNHLESETLKSSLHHAHRMIQNLKGNIHREKTEKIELKRLLQEARDELELRRVELGGPSSGSKRQKTKPLDTFKKPLRPGMLGLGRTSKTEIELEEPDWEDHVGQDSPSQAASSRYFQGDADNRGVNPTDLSDAYQTANETEDAFETANERETGTESEAFQTGAESLAGDSSDELTETEQTAERTATITARRPAPISLTKPGNRTSYLSTASTSAGEEDEEDARTPIQTQMPRYRLKMNRGSQARRSRFADDSPALVVTPGSNKDSPASFISNRSPSIQTGQSLFAELNDLNGEDVEFGTPSKSSIYSGQSTPGQEGQKPLSEQIIAKGPDMIDSSMQTEPWEPIDLNQDKISAPEVVATTFAHQGTQSDSPPADLTDSSTQYIPADSTDSSTQSTPAKLIDSSTQYVSADSIDSSTQQTPHKNAPAGKIITPPKTEWDESSERSQARNLALSPLASQYTEPRAALALPLALSTMRSLYTEPQSPIQETETIPVPQSAFSPMLSLSTEPQSPIQETQPIPIPQLAFSSMETLSTEPEVAPIPQLTFSSMRSLHTEPQSPTRVSQLALSPMHSLFTEAPQEPEALRVSPLAFSPMSSLDTIPQSPVQELEVARDSRLAFSSMRSLHTEPHSPIQETEVAPVPQLAFSSMSSLDTEPQSPIREIEVAPTLRLAFSPINSLYTEPELPIQEPEAAPVSRLAFSPMHSLFTELPQEPEVAPVPRLAFSPMHPLYTQLPQEPEAAPVSRLAFSPMHSLFTELPQEPEAAPKPPLTFSSMRSQYTEPQSPAQPIPAPKELLALSTVRVQQIEPISPVLAVESGRGIMEIPATPTTVRSGDSDDRPKTAERIDPKSAAFGAVFGRGMGRRGSRPSIAEDETSQEPGSQLQGDNGSPMPFRDISANIGAAKSIPKSDHGSQTILSSDQIDQLLLEKTKRITGPVGRSRQIGEFDILKPTPISPLRSERLKPQLGLLDGGSKELSPKRPTSASSQKLSMTTYPPLPADHKLAIEAAQRVSSSGTISSTMGPPLAPASAYRTNSRLSQRSVDNPQSPNSKAGTTPKARPARSTTSRRSSVSSFASELDERFNIRANEFGVPHGFESNTDPRMIQAITQTMIGEFLWKYTRKAGRPDMSSTRHRRYFWVHPYTRTLYWSDQDPQSAGRNELKAKSVAIEAVRVISDDNPMPPGLHRKSLEVITPGRKIMFTAATGQRHETWFNALSYLLLRTNGPENTEQYTTDDVREFNPRISGVASRSSRVAPSLSSYNSRTTQNTTQRAHSTTSASRVPLNLTLSGGSTRSQQQPQFLGTPTSVDSTNSRQTSIARLSSMFKPGTIRGSFSSRRSRTDERGVNDDSIYDASLVPDSIDESQPAEPVKESEGLENVRACCDGKHDVSSLSRTGRHSSVGARHHSHGPGASNMGSRAHR